MIYKILWPNLLLFQFGNFFLRVYRWTWSFILNLLKSCHELNLRSTFLWHHQNIMTPLVRQVASDILRRGGWIKIPVATCPFEGERGEAHECAFQRRKDARSRHQRLFVENVGKTEGNRSKWKFYVRELYLRLRKVLAPLTFVSKDNNLFFRIGEIVLP